MIRIELWRESGVFKEAVDMSEKPSLSLNGMVEEFLVERGAIRVGVATVETLAGGPPSTDLEYCLEGARSAVSFALPLDRDRTPSWPRRTVSDTRRTTSGPTCAPRTSPGSWRRC